MNDLFESMQEHAAERLAIMQESGVPDAVIAAGDDLFRCEVKSIIRRFYPDANKAAEYFDLVEKKRGKTAADMLRDGCRAEWKARQAQDRGR